jgi:diaminohydroxyphosphoribosylaminopyrimidine deaminase/5-amino-6-(5-phosphoribosylamino)uracil reductase
MGALTTDEHFMREALRCAVRGRGLTSPNPEVGAVIVQAGEIVGRGWHEKVGGAHAEVNAIRRAGGRAAGATLYVTLEPCNHQGRTPPCTLAVLAAGIARVVAGMADPNPLVSGGGMEMLRSHGLMVRSGVLEEACRLINQPFIKHVSTGMPYVMVKAAATLDGRIATRSGDSRWITNERSRRFVHRLRCDLDAILVGIGTALTDDPLLTARLPRRACRQPVRILLDSTLRLPLGSQLVRSAHQAPLWIACCEDAPPGRQAALRAAGAEVLALPGGAAGVDLTALLRELGRRQVTSLLVEGGGRVLGSFFEQQLADGICFFYAPKILADADAVPMIHGRVCERMVDAVPVHALRVRRFGGDVMLTGRLREEIY